MTADRPQLLEMHETRVETPRVPLLYQLGLGLAALAMLILPLVYLAFIGLVAYGTYYHAFNHAGILTIEGGGARWRAIAYVAPIVAGVVAVVFLVKPLFAPRVAPPPPNTLDPEEEPLLFAYVARLCELLGAPVPRRIDVDLEVNASASFRGGVRSFLGKDLVLTIGLPLVCGLNLREFTGVLAHEFGHFTQAAAMRLSYVVASVNHWFARVVHERDQWDQKLYDAQNVGPWYAQLVVALSQLCVWLSRRILWVLMMIGRAVSSFLSRQMEFNADAHQVQIAGSDEFKDTQIKIHRLSLASRNALESKGEMWQNELLFDDVVALVAVLEYDISVDKHSRKQAEEELIGAKTGLLDTHPAPRDRIHRASALEQDGLLISDEPANALFSDFAELSRSTTLEDYRHHLGEYLRPESLVSSEISFADHHEKADGKVAAEEFFARSYYPLVGMFPVVGIFPERLDTNMESGDAEDALARKSEMLAALDAGEETLERLVGVRARLRNLSIGIGLAAAHVEFDPSNLGLPNRDLDQMLEKRAELRDKSEVARSDLESLLRATAARAGKTVRYAREHQLDLEPELAATIERVPKIAAAFEALKRVWPIVESLRVDAQTLDGLFQFEDEYRKEPDYQAKGHSLLTDITKALESIAERTADTEYPYQYAAGPVSIQGYLVPEKLPRDMRAVSIAMVALDRMETLYGRMWGEVARVVLAVEEAAEKRE